MLSNDLQARARTWPLGLALAALSACTTVSLEPTPGRAQRPVPVASPPAPPSVVVAPAPPVAQTAPVTSSQLPPPAPLGQPAGPEAPPYGPAVSARFPDPDVVYRTPAFEPGRTGFTTNAEVRSILNGFAVAGAQRADVRLLALGTSQNGEPLEALLFARPGGSASARTEAGLINGRPTVLLVGQQHGDEPAGSEALLVIAQELTQGRLAPLLDRINVVVFPRANPDGAEANRRSTANGIDANRDHLLLKTPEAQAQALLMREYAPVVTVDAHEYTVVGRYLEKFGTVQRFDALLQYATTANVPDFVTKAAEEWFRRPAVAKLRDAGLTAEWYYTTTTDIADKKISMGGTQPDTGRNVNGLTNAISILIETRGVGIGRLHLKRRVHSHVVAISSILQDAATRAADLVKLRQFVDNEVSALACRGEVVIEAGPTSSEYRLLMLDPVTGADKPLTVAWDSALTLRPLKLRPRPCGYWLGEQEADAVQRLRALGVEVIRIERGAEVRGEIYRETEREVAQRQDVRGPLADAGGIVRVKVQTVPALVDMKAGSYYVPLDQPLANLIIAALEPDTQNSFFANRLINSIDRQARMLEQVELKGSTVP
ncbi:MAG: M14 family metallocarboxypeptidase [Caldimonas sp.]